MSQDPRALNDDLNIIANTPIPGLDDDLANISKLADEPNDSDGLSAAELKAKFDQAGLTIQDYINTKLIPAVLGTAAQEAVREANEDQRKANETQRHSQEAARQSQESARQSAEADRAGSESARRTAENARAAAETGRVSAESSRENAETARETAEAARETAQTAFFDGVTAEANTLPAGSQATAAAVRSGDSFKVTFGIPKGDGVPKIISNIVPQLLGINADGHAAEWTSIAQVPYMGGLVYVLTSQKSDGLPDQIIAGYIPDTMGTAGQVYTKTESGAGWRNLPKSAYQLAVEGGYTGTEDDFKDILGSGPWLCGRNGFFDFTAGPDIVSLPNLVDNNSIVSELHVKDVMELFNIPIRGVGDPEFDYDAANKLYVDNAIADVAKLPGPAGEDGRSAYEYAVAGGYTGTEAEFTMLMGSGPWLPVSGGTVTGQIHIAGSGRIQYDANGPFIYPGAGARIPTLMSNGAIAYMGNRNVKDSRLQGIDDPVNGADAANKDYVDTTIAAAITGAMEASY